MSDRPVYLGVGECDCKRIDARLFQVPGSSLDDHPVCALCLVRRGYTVPAPRTANDVVEVDGHSTWKTSAPPADRLDLGHGHVFDAVLGSDGQLVGWLHTHPDARSVNGTLCQSFCAVRAIDGAPIHQIVSVDALTLTPSLLCRTCGAHGQVTNGTWEPC